MFVAVCILTHHDGARRSNLEGKFSSTFSRLLVLVACALQHLCMSLLADHTSDMDTLADLAETFISARSQSEASKLDFTPSSFYGTINDKDTLPNYWGIILPMGRCHYTRLSTRPWMTRSAPPFQGRSVSRYEVTSPSSIKEALFLVSLHIFQ
jgi:hypothetical protein